MSIVIQGGIKIGPGINIGNQKVPGVIVDFVEEDGTTLFITEDGNQLIEENT